MPRPPVSNQVREQRINQLIDAAIQLWLNNPDRLATVSEVAKAAGIAKGTVYLYFRAKEDLLLAAHERHTHAFFNALILRTDDPAPMDFDDMMQLVRDHITQVPGYLPLATLMNSLVDKAVTPEVANAFEQRIQQRLRQAGTRLCQHFPLPDALAGVRLLMQSYGLILGLWQVLGSESCRRTFTDDQTQQPPDFHTELDAALRALWHGTLSYKEPDHA